MWEAALDGRTLTFHLAGSNNQNFLMRDAETGSWWQQASGMAVRGPLQGRHLREIPHEELTFATWRMEHPGGRVLRPDPAALAADDYASADWEEKMATRPVVTPLPEGDVLKPRDMILGVTSGTASRAYPGAVLRGQGVLLDELGGVPLAVVLSDDGRSVRVFDRRIDGCTLDLYAVKGSWPLQLVDGQTGSTWDFSGTATGGDLRGQPLARLAVLPEYWFDWRTYHPDTSVYSPF